MIASVADFIRYFESIRRRTWAVVDRVTPDLIDWAPRAGEFTCGEIVRHLAGAERFYVTKVLDDQWTSDFEPGPRLDHAATRERLKRTHEQEMARLATLPDAELTMPRRDLEGGTVRCWRFLMMLVEHEVHHRSQLDAWLAEAGVEPPQLYGYRMEEVLSRVAREGAGGRA
jgi:uncharacterized damage-inducible protein DinB